MKTLFYILLGIAFLLGNVKGATSINPQVERLEIQDREMLAEWTQVPQEGALHLTVQNTEQKYKIQITLQTGSSHVQFLPDELIFPLQKRQIRSFPVSPLTDGKTYWLTFRRKASAWILYLEGTPVLRLPELWSGPMTILHPKAATPTEDEKDEYAQRLGSLAFSDAFMVPEGSDFPQTWEKISGLWKLHSVTGNISGSAIGRYKLSRQPLPEKSPNFYTMEGSGNNAILLAGEPFYGHYRYQASVQHNSGTNGIVFLAEERGDYYAFTAQTAPKSQCVMLDLWHQPADKKQKPIFLDTIQTAIPIGQWLLLEVRIFDDRLICLADHIEVIRHKLPLPPCGRFGLFSNTPISEPTRFDDVSVHSQEDIPLDTPDDLELAVHACSPDIQISQKDGKNWIEFPKDEYQFWETATATSQPLSFSTRLISISPDFTCGLSCGSTGSQTPFYRFTCDQKKGTRTFTLEQITFLSPSQRTNASAETSQKFVRKTTVLDRFVEKGNSQQVRLTLDALHPHELRAQADGKTVCFTRPAHQPGGFQRIEVFSAKGIRAAPPTISSFDIRPVERFEKNPLYVKDPFMRHWASPEGQWVTFTNKQTWLKSDLLGPATLRFPVVDPSIIHLGVPENATTSPCKIVVTNTLFSLYTPASDTKAICSIPITHFSQSDVQDSGPFFMVGINDHVLWIGGETNLLAQTHLSSTLPGRRIRVEGFQLPHLRQTQIKRERVFDTLFNESLHDWTLNGGRWEIINRFYCEPTWSHMNGENADSLAAIWSKYIFSGNFSVDFYAGFRMGWYNRPGDLNLTVMSKKCSPSDGYTAITAGWDPNHSGIYNRLLRNGKPIAISTQYTVPRHRDGNIRHGYQPLVAKGRDVHGAWYEMQFRRIGNKLKYSFDNEEIFQAKDPFPLQDGALGIWTFRNSMMVSRIRIAAESIRPRPFAFHSLPAGTLPQPPPQIPTDSGIRINGRHAELLTPAFWESEDPVSHPVIQFTDLGTPSAVMKVTSLLGGGSFHARCNLPDAEPGQLLGWHFEIARSHDAKVNFEFRSQVADDQGRLQTINHWSHILSGTDETRGPRKICGHTEAIPPSNENDLIWTPVNVWIPAIELRGRRRIQIEGFGNLQPSDIVEGLQGNQPGVWFAIRNFREIYRGRPVLTGPAEKKVALANFMQKILSLRSGKHHTLTLPEFLSASCPVVDWVTPAQAIPPLKVIVDPRAKDALLLTHEDPWPCPFFPLRKVLINQHPCSTQIDGNAVQILIPHELRRNGPMLLEVTLADKRIFRQQITFEQKKNEPPILLSLRLPEGGIETFENRPCNVSTISIKALSKIKYGNSSHGDVLQISNNGSPTRLWGKLIKNFNPIETPVIQFWYRGDPMAQVALGYGKNGFNFTEQIGPSVRYGGPFAPIDSQWRPWTGIPQDNEGIFPLSKVPAADRRSIRIGSMKKYDSTGLYSHIEIDNLATGPAVGPKRIFAFQANYTDPDGIDTVEYAILRGPLPYAKRPKNSQQKIKWISVQNEEVVQPALTTIPEGLHHLLVRAKDSLGAYSQISDEPFIHDRTPPTVSYQLAECPEMNGSKLMITIKDLAAPPVFSTLAFACLGRPLHFSPDHGNIRLGAGTLNYTINWIWLLQKELETAQQGSILPIQISGIVDAAGNQAPPSRVDIQVNLENDNHAPTILPPIFPKNLFCHQFVISKVEQLATDQSHVTAKILQTPEGSVFDLISTEEKKRFIRHHFPRAWDPERYPWLAFSFRCVDTKPTKTAPFNISFFLGGRKPQGVKNGQTFNFYDKESFPFLVSRPLQNIHEDEWVDVLINVRDFLKEKIDSPTEMPNITYLSFNIRERSIGKHIQIRSFAVLAPWKSDDLLALKPYDLNGIQCLSWEGGGQTHLTGIRPAQITPPKITPHALRFRISDKKGNKTNTWTIPIPPDSINDKPALKAFEKVEY